jgi:phage terminase large subunit
MRNHLTFYIPPKLEPFLKKKKRYKIAIGGRGSGKSQSIADMDLYSCANHGQKLCYMREFQSSIADSSYPLLESEIERIGIPGYRVKHSHIEHSRGGQIRFKGLARSIHSVKSMFGFNGFRIEEAQFLSEDSIRVIKPTLRAPESETWLIMNPGSSEDPVSKEFLNSYWDILRKEQYYEDDRRLIVLINYRDNPFFPQELEEERLEDLEKLPRALYDHIWEGDFNDSVENSLILREWFDACVDAHKKLNFKIRGLKIVGHDPSDTGDDTKGLACRHGNVITDVQERAIGDVNDGLDWATDYAISNGANIFTWDGDGMGIGLKKQVRENLKGTHIDYHMFRGSEGVEKPDDPFEDDEKIEDIKKRRMNKQALLNKRSQYYWRLRNRCYNTFLAVKKGKFIHDSDNIISFSSEIPNKILLKLRSEICRIPTVPNGRGLIQIMAKKDMKRLKPPIASPNLADSVMETMIIPDAINNDEPLDFENPWGS